MAINPSSFSTQSIQSTQFAVIEIVGGRPDLNFEINPPETPGRMVGYYNTNKEMVELFVTSAGATFWIEVG